MASDYTYLYEVHKSIGRTYKVGKRNKTDLTISSNQIGNCHLVRQGRHYTYFHCMEFVIVLQIDDVKIKPVYGETVFKGC